MNQVEELQQLYFRGVINGADFEPCSEWAVRRLEADEQGDDLEVVSLSASTRDFERRDLIETILRRYLGGEGASEEFLTGKYIASLRKDYLRGSVDVEALDGVICKLYGRLKYPDWMVMLTRNCEYATDVPGFQEPFELEFEYIAGLWELSGSLADFYGRYDSKISRSHDFPK